MDPISNKIASGAAGAAGAAEPLYVEDVFSTYLYTGNGSSQTITNGIDLSGEGGLVFGGHRNGTSIGNLDRWFYDTARGTGQALYPSTTNGQGYDANGISSFNSDGFTLPSGNARHNDNGYTYASWTFRKAEKFFDVVTYTGNGTAGRTISHNLGSVPGCIIIKRTDSAEDWLVYHRGLGPTKGLYLNDNTTQIVASTFFNNTEPTSTVFTVGTNTKGNALDGTYVAYLFAHDAGGFGEDETESVIKCGSYTGNASGVDLNLGWEPQWVLIKRASGTGTNYTNWYIFDNMRGVATGGTDTPLAANLATEENGTYLYGTANPANLIEFSSTGIRVDPGGSQFTAVNTANENYVYVAIRRGPMKTPEDATEVFAIDTQGSTQPGVSPGYRSNFVVDMFLKRNNDGGTANTIISSRLTQGQLATGTTEAEAGSEEFDYSNGFEDTNTANSNRYAWMFRRAPSFMDVVAYTGTGSARTVSHNLGVAPELMIVKRRESTGQWRVYSAVFGGTHVALINNTTNFYASSGYWNNTNATSSVFTVGTQNDTNASSGTYIAYLFATCPGVSKVGSYTGTGTTLDVNCGFSAGARFVLIKCADSTGNWYVWDTARGIVSGNDPYFLLNSAAAEVTNTDYIDPLSTGFQISSSAPAAINANGGSYIFLAIA